jgi:simple sugar transport system ATP-binding protein
VGDRFVILSRGRLAGTFARQEIDETALNRLMGGGAEFEALQRELAELDARLKSGTAPVTS